MKKINSLFLVSAGLLLTVALVSSGFAWWLNERTQLGPGGIPLPPRTKVLRTESPGNNKINLLNVSCQSPRSAQRILDFYTNTLVNDGWQTTKLRTNTYQFAKGHQTLRLVLHPHKQRTDFTLNMRSKNPSNKK